MNTHYRKKLISFVILLFSSALLTGCCYGVYPDPIRTALSQQEAQAAYEGLQEELEILLESPYAFTAGVDSLDTVVFYKTEEYQVAFAEINYDYYEEPVGNYLWYDGALYWYNDYLPEGVEMSWSWREADWEEFGAEEFLEAVIDCGIALLQEEPASLEYYRYPDSNNTQYQLTVDYPLTSVAIETEPVYADISAGWDKDGNLSSFFITWNRPYINHDRDLVKVKVMPYEDSLDYQAERKIWTVGHDLGLCETPVPALTTQVQDRAWCEKMINSMDFKKLQTPGTRDDELPFQSPYTQIRLRYIEGTGYMIE